MLHLDAIAHPTDLSDQSLTFAILGAGGDLTSRLLLPAIGRLCDASPQLKVHLRGAARTAMAQEEWRSLIQSSLSAAGVSEQTRAVLSDSAEFLVTDASNPGDLKALLDSCPSAPVLYVALPPAVGEGVAAALGKIDLPDDLRVAVEKPFGSDLAGAESLNAAFAQVLSPEQLWRIDHFLGNAALEQLLELRVKKTVLQSSWDFFSISKIEVIFDEAIGLESRASFYESTGALRDMLQSHLLLLAAHITLDVPDQISTPEVHGKIEEVLTATRLWRDDPGLARRAQYSAGRSADQQLPAYSEEPGVAADSQTETAAQLILQVDVPRWQGVPIALRSGKAIEPGHTGILIHLTPEAKLSSDFQVEHHALLYLSLSDGSVELVDQPPKPTDTPTRTVISTARDEAAIDPYTQVLAGLVDHNQLLSVSGVAAELCWRIVTPALDAFADGTVQLDTYPAGSPGPKTWGTDGWEIVEAAE